MSLVLDLVVDSEGTAGSPPENLLLFETGETVLFETGEEIILEG